MTKRIIWRHWCGASLVPNDELEQCPFVFSNEVHLPLKDIKEVLKED